MSSLAQCSFLFGLTKVFFSSTDKCKRKALELNKGILFFYDICIMVLFHFHMVHDSTHLLKYFTIFERERENGESVSLIQF